MTTIAILATAYLLGSIPFGYLLVRIFRGEDVRKSGSGNIGATNVARKAPGLGALTLFLDAAKGWIAVHISTLALDPLDPRLPRLMAACALFAIVGHMFPVWLKFRGGKGVATALGSFLRFSPAAVCIAIIIFVGMVALFRRISLGSIVTAALFPLAVWIADRSSERSVLLLTATAALLIIVRHHQNIRRLLSGDEPKFSLSKE